MTDLSDLWQFGICLSKGSNVVEKEKTKNVEEGNYVSQYCLDA